MKEQQAGAPLKVCPNCSVATRTDADTCPGCGGRYSRRRLVPRLSWRWSWWFAIPIAGAAFALGYFGLSTLDDEESDVEGRGITLEQGAAVPDGASRSSLADHLGGESPVLVQPQRGEERVECAYYAISGEPDSVWEFCFEGDKLFSSAPIGESDAGSQLESSAPAPEGRSGRAGGG